MVALFYMPKPPQGEKVVEIKSDLSRSLIASNSRSIIIINNAV